MTEDLKKLESFLRLKGLSEETISNYIGCIKRFKIYFEGKELKQLNEEDILNYITNSFINLERSASTINVNLAAIKNYYLINFKKELNSKLLPSTKVHQRYPHVLSNEDIMFLIENTEKLKYKVWLCLAYGSGLRVSEVASVKISNFSYNQKKIKVIGKGNKERYTVFPDYTHDILLKYYAENKDEIIASGGYLFPSKKRNSKNKHITRNTIEKFFTDIKEKYELNEDMSFHTLRHSFATEFIKGGGDILDLKELMGHVSIVTTIKYIHIAKNYNSLYSPIDRRKK